MSSAADYVVLRQSPDLPDGWMPPDMDGRWYDLAAVPIGFRAPLAGYKPGTAYGVPTGRFEVRDDGAVAEVYEVRMWPNR